MNGAKKILMGRGEALELARAFMEKWPAENPDHPVLPWFTAPEALAEKLEVTPVEELAQEFEAREKRIRLTDTTNPDRAETFDLLNWGWGDHISSWKDADELLRGRILWLYLSGSIRSSKSTFMDERAVRTALEFPGVEIWFVNATEESSWAGTQKYVWWHLPPEVRALNFKTDPHRKYWVRYTPGRGFSDGLCVLPKTGSILRFKTFTQDPESQQGSELGVPRHLWAAHARKLAELELNKARTPEEEFELARLRKVHNIGAVADESMTPEWFRLLMTRCRNRGSQTLWGFTPEAGITPTIRTLVGRARTLKARRADLLPGRKIAEDCPEGYVPYVAEPVEPKGRVIYFPAEANPFSFYYARGGIREAYEGNPDAALVERAVYGYARDVVARPFPNFGAWNVVPVEELPAEGTNYLFVDPHGRRPDFTIWVRVTRNRDYYVYREFPWVRAGAQLPAWRILRQGFGDWAVPSKRLSVDGKRGMDGDRGPAQQANGFGPVQYRRMWLDMEAITELQPPADPHRRKLWEQALRGLGEKERTPTAIADALARVDAREAVVERFSDPRPLGTNTKQNDGTLTLQEQYLQHGVEDGRPVPPLLLKPARSGASRDAGLAEFNGLLAWDRSKPLSRPYNSPRFYIAENCESTIWALNNWTGEEGDAGACDDPIACLRYMASTELHYHDPGRALSRGGRSH
jgi:hypothetical protein